MWSNGYVLGKTLVFCKTWWNLKSTQAAELMFSNCKINLSRRVNAWDVWANEERGKREAGEDDQNILKILNIIAGSRCRGDELPSADPDKTTAKEVGAYQSTVHSEMEVPVCVMVVLSHGCLTDSLGSVLITVINFSLPAHAAFLIVQFKVTETNEAMKIKAQKHNFQKRQQQFQLSYRTRVALQRSETPDGPGSGWVSPAFA